MVVPVLLHYILGRALGSSSWHGRPNGQDCSRTQRVTATFEKIFPRQTLSGLALFGRSSLYMGGGGKVNAQKAGIAAFLSRRGTAGAQFGGSGTMVMLPGAMKRLDMCRPTQAGKQRGVTAGHQNQSVAAEVRSEPWQVSFSIRFEPYSQRGVQNTCYATAC
jgi:hypothetical protein